MLLVPDSVNRALAASSVMPSSPAISALGPEGALVGPHEDEAWYHDVMTRRSTTVRMPEKLAETAEVVARARGVSVNELVLDALQAEFDRVRNDTEFMKRLRALVERDKEILDRLAE